MQGKVRNANGPFHGLRSPWSVAAKSPRVKFWPIREWTPPGGSMFPPNVPRNGISVIGRLTGRPFAEIRGEKARPPRSRASIRFAKPDPPPKIPTASNWRLSVSVGLLRVIDNQYFASAARRFEPQAQLCLNRGEDCRPGIRIGSIGRDSGCPESSAAHLCDPLKVNSRCRSKAPG